VTCLVLMCHVCDRKHSYMLWIRDKTPAYAGDDFICDMTHACVWRRRYATHMHDFYM